MHILHFMNNNFSPEVTKLKAATLNPKDNESSTLVSTFHEKI
jgi:hypothetical protein